MTQTTDTTSPAAQLVLDWAQKLFEKERGRVRRRAARVRDGRVEDFDVESLMRAGPEGLAQAAAVLARTVADADLVAILMPGKVQDARQGAHRRTGFAPGATATVAARSRDGELVALSLRLEQDRRLKGSITRAPLNEKALTRFGDWTDALFVVDPAVDAHLLAVGFPGARAPEAPKVDPLALMSPQEAPTLGPRRPEAVVASAVARAARAEAVTAEPTAYPWAAARAIRAEMDDLMPRELGPEPFAVPPAGEPFGIKRREFADLVAHGWSNDGQACRVAKRIEDEKEPGRALAEALASSLPAVAKTHACAWAALRARQLGDGDVARDAGAELVARVDAEIAAAGGEAAWLEVVWPHAPRPGDEIGTVSITNASAAAFWRASFAWSAAQPFEPGAVLPPGSPLRVALARMAELRDRLLDRLAPPDEVPGRRVVETSRALFPSLPSDDGEPDLRRFWAEVLKRSGTHTAANVFPAAATLHAAVLHGLFVISETFLAGTAALGDADTTSYGPERVPVAGLLARARLVLARHCVQCARHPPEERSLALLAHAARLAPNEDAIQACFNEARFRAGRHDEALVADLLAEANGNAGLAAAAEALTIAEALGRPRDAKVARKRMTRLVDGTPHGWIADVRATFGRRDLFVDAKRLRRLEMGGPPDALDPAERVVLALYGPDPAERIAFYRRALPAQREAVEWAAAEAGERAEKKAAGPAGVGLRRPEVPARPSDAAVMRALGALQFRLDLPKIAKHPGRRRAIDHARRAAELGTFDDASPIGPWLAALDAGGSDPGRAGLVPALDALIAAEGPSPEAAARVEAGVAAADAALAEVLASSWSARFEASLRPMWATLAHLPDAAGPAKDLTALLERAAEARDDAARERADAERRAFVDRVEGAVAARWASEAEAATSDEPVVQRFKQMVVSEAALTRSRRELATPAWAIDDGKRQILLYNLAEGRRDQKALHLETVDGRPMSELRHRGRELPVRVVFVLAPEGPRVLAVMVKHDEAEQNRLLQRIAGWES